MRTVVVEIISLIKYDTVILYSYAYSVAFGIYTETTTESTQKWEPVQNKARRLMTMH